MNVSPAGLIERLAERLRWPLPGARAQAALQPELGYGRYFGPPPRGAVPAAVMVLLFPQQDRWHLPLTLRPASMAQHAGQISLPGGLVEPGESTAQAALRELEEELGVRPESVTPLGELSPVFLYRSNFAVTPWLAVAGETPRWRPNPSEVAELLEVPLAHLSDPAARGRQARASGGVSFSAPCFHWGGHAIWGATSLILAELLAVVGELERKDA